MANIVQITVGTTGSGANFTGPGGCQAAIDSIPKNVVASGNRYYVGIQSGELDLGSGALANISSDYITDIDHYITIGPALGQGYRDNANLGTVALAYNPANGAAVKTTQAYSALITSAADFTVVEGLQFTNPNPNDVVKLTGDNCTVRFNLGLATAFQYVVNGPTTTNLKVYRNIFYGNIAQSGGGGAQGSGVAFGNTASVCNNVFVGTSTSSNGRNAMYTYGNGPMDVSNNLVFLYNAGLLVDSPSTTVNSDGHNSTDLASAFATRGADSSTVYAQSIGDYFVGSTSAGWDFRPKSTSPAIDSGSASAYIDSLNKITAPSGAEYDRGAWEYLQAATFIQPNGSSTGFVGVPQNIVVTKNGSLSGTVRVTPSDNGGGGSFSPTFYDWVEGGAAPTFAYTGTSGTKTISVTNNAGLGNGTPLTVTLTVAPPTINITSQPDPDGQSLGPVAFTTTGAPTSATATLSPASTPNGAQTASGVVTLGTNSGSAQFSGIQPGNYTLSITVTNAGGTVTAAGTSQVTINTISGNPQAPNPGGASSVASVVVSPDGTTLSGGATQQFTAVVNGTNAPSQAVTWSKVSGVGTINSSGLYTAPSATSGAQSAVCRATSVQDSTYFDEFAITVSAATVTPTVTGVTISPDGATVQGGATQQFTATVQGANSPSQAVTWSKTSGPGAVVSGLYSAPAATSAQQIAILRATSQQDASYYDEVQVIIPAASVTPPAYATRIVFGAVPETAGDPVINASGLQYTVWAESTIGALHTIIAQGSTLNIVNGAGQIDITGQQVLLPGDTAYFIWGDAANTMSGRGPVTVS